MYKLDIVEQSVNFPPPSNLSRGGQGTDSLFDSEGCVIYILRYNMISHLVLKIFYTYLAPKT